jgi:hypothetical protein
MTKATGNLFLVYFDDDILGLHLLYASSPIKARVEMMSPKHSKYKLPSMC